MPPATMRMRDKMSGMWRRMRIHCMRLPLGRVVVLSKEAVVMNKGVSPSSVRIATPLSKVEFGAVLIGNSSVAARSIDT
jgi:hypothetical protein